MLWFFDDSVKNVVHNRPFKAYFEGPGIHRPYMEAVTHDLLPLLRSKSLDKAWVLLHIVSQQWYQNDSSPCCARWATDVWNAIQNTQLLKTQNAAIHGSECSYSTPCCCHSHYRHLFNTKKRAWSMGGKVTSRDIHIKRRQMWKCNIQMLVK